MSGRAASGPHATSFTPEPCRRCTGLGDAHYLTCPTLRYDRDAAVARAARASIEAGEPLIPWEDIKAAAVPP